MSYQALARKWRPKSFATLVGQEHVVKALTHALAENRLHHAYLFTGTRGVGKTTLARIMSKALNCDRGVSPEPCGVCSSCQEIDGGRFVDYIELDAASNRGVDDMTQLLERAAYAPTRGRYKVYVIDEVHQLSGHAFNAMLKTLEEPPEHVKFILATTDPQKIPVTVLSRCLQFNLKQMPQAAIVGHLSAVLAQEGVPYEAAALRQLAKGAAGSMRDALSLLDQAIAHGAGKVEEEGVRDMLGTVGDEFLHGLLEGLANGDVAAMLSLAEQMNGRSLSFESALQELATLFHRVALAQMAPAALSDDGERCRLQRYAGAFDPEFVQLCYQITIHGRDDLPLAPDEYAGFVMTLLRLHAFRPETPPALGTGTSDSGVRSLPVPASRTAAPKPAQPDFTPAGVKKSEPAIPPVPAAADAGTSGSDWHGLVARMNLSGMARQLANHCDLACLDEEQAILHLPPAHKHLAAKSALEKLQAELRVVLDKQVRISLVLAEPGVETPAERSRTMQRERQEKAVASIEQDAFVREAIDLFDASIDESTIKPI